MKQLFVLLAFFFSSIIEINAQTYGLDNTDPSVFTKFRVPDTDLRSLWFNTSLNFWSDKTENISSDNINASTHNYKSSEFNYALSPNYYLLNESDSMNLSLKVNLTGQYSRYYYESIYSGDSYPNTIKQNTYSANLVTDFTYNRYVNNGDAFYSVSASMNVIMDDMKRDENYGTSTNIYEGSKTQSYTFSFGIGGGKLRNVTPVVSAIRFQERLKQLNLLNDNLSDKTIENLAQQLYKQTYYSDVYDRSGKYFWQGVEKTLSGDGVSLNDLNMYAANYLMETVNEIRFMRQEGFITGIDLQFNYLNNYDASTYYNYSLTEQLFMLVNAYVNYSTQLNLNSQLNFGISVSSGPNVLAKPSGKQKYYLNSGIGYNYELTDRIVTSIGNTFTLIFIEYSNQQKLLTNILNFSLRYFIEDNLSLNATYSWQHTDYKYYTNYYSDTNNYHYVNIGFTYYLQRGFLFN